MQSDPAGFLELVSRIHADPRPWGPAGIRTAVSRCYYSALLTAWSLLERSGVKIRAGDGMHVAVVRALLSRSSGACQRLGDDLANMNEMRIAADLDPGSPVGEDDLAHAYSLARVFNRDVARRLNP